MPRFSANLGFLWADLDLPDAVRAAAAAGFDAVECHWPFDTDPDVLAAALAETGLPLLGLNTSRGRADAGEFGLSAIPGRGTNARAAIDQALAYAEAVDAQAVHVMAGIAQGEDAKRTFEDHLRYACDRTGQRTILIEPINTFDVPGYFLSQLSQAAEVIASIQAPNLKLMFDCYHVARSGMDVRAQLRDYLPIIGHVQFAGVPDRGPPDHGTLDYAEVFQLLDDLGWSRPLGAEYRPDGTTDASLGWMTHAR